MKSELINGAYVTLITPFKDNGEIDIETLKELVERQIESGIRGICPMGVTGETAALTDQEKILVIQTVVNQVNGRVQVIPDIGTECFSRTLELAKECEKMKVDAVIVLAPYLDTPTEQGLYEYYYELANAVKIPILLHNVPGRTNINLSPTLIAKLAKHPNIIGIKDGNTTLEHIMEVLNSTQEVEFSVLTGKDTLGYPLLKLGGHGHISVAANLLPEVIVKIVKYMECGNDNQAYKIYNKHYKLFKNLYLQTNPIPMKYLLNRTGINVGKPRIPLTMLDDSHAIILDQIIDEIINDKNNIC